MKHSVTGFLITVITAMIVASCASLPEYQSVNLETSTEAPRKFVDMESKIVYTVQHDSRFLYINLSTAEPSSQRQIMMQGLTLWFDETAKRKEYIGFSYPLAERPQRAGEPGQFAERPEGEMQNQSQALMKRFETQISYIELVGFLEDGSKERLNYRLEKGPVKVDISMDDSGNLLYQARVPLQNIFTDESAKDRMLSVGIESNAPEGRGGSGPPAGGPPGGGGGMPQGGGMAGGGGQGGPPGGGPDMESSSSIDFWFKVLI